MGAQIFFENYSPIGDITTAAICIVIFILVATSYVKKTNAFYLFLNIVVYLLLACLTDLLYHTIYVRVTDGNYTAVYILRVVYHAFLFSNLLLYVVYIIVVQDLERSRSRLIRIAAMVIYFTVITIDVIYAVRGSGYKTNKSGDAMSAMNIFMYGYAAFMLLIAHLLLAYRKLFYRRIMFGFYGTIAMSFILLFNQGRHGHSSFTTVAFLFPVIAMLYILHSNPYDNIELGTVNARAFEDMVSSSYRKKKDFIFASLYLPELDVEGRSIPREIYESIRRFSIDFFKGAQLFQITNGHMILAAWTSLNPDYKYRLGRMLNAFQTEYMKYRYDYKIVIGSSIDEVSRTNEGLSFIRNIHRGMKINDIHRVSAEDVEAFKETKYIIEELVDIFKKKDLNDPRVLVFCQPVYNIKNGRYDTAEALMRLELPKTGMVYPDRFIPLAEEYGFIHVLTEILLNKTCKAIKAFLDEGYDFKRISVNVSSLEMRDDEFNNDMNRIILESGIPDNKIAFEITESQSEMDFMLLKSKINELKGRGIKFYLDDFGTGYSNMERILELPFDIIKFDKSLVIASDNNERSRMMVESLADMFARTNYSVLYEGIETESDEERCINMSASYLQGYKYSRPVPINELKAFLSNCHLFHT